MVIVDQRQTPPDLSDLACPAVTLSRSRSFMNTPASQVFHRVYELLDECLQVARLFEPDLILYDFCALEGHFVGRSLDIPTWCSIPGLVGPLTHTGYLRRSLSSPVNRKAIRSIERRYGLAVNRADIEVISNSLHIPAEVNLLWSYPSITPPTFLHRRKKARYEFAGYLSDGYSRPEAPSERPLVYLSFGTEVMDNLWPTEEETRAGVRRCVAGLAEAWNHEHVEVVFVTQEKPVLDRYPANWMVYDKVDQQEVLSRTDVFVTHGGSNSFHEAVLARVPMVVVPFFGDQVLVAARAEELGIGIDVVDDRDINKNKSKEFLNTDLVDRIDDAVFQILDNEKYRKSFDDLPVEALPPLAGFVPEPDSGLALISG